jgi:cytochrome c-type biogenesis protein
LDGDTLRLAVEALGPLAFGIGFLAGLAFSFNPVALAAIPVSLAYVTRTRERTEAMKLGAAFVVGMLLAHLAIGAIAGFGGHWIEEAIGRWWGLVIGPLLILMGLLWPGWLRLPLPRIALRASRPAGPFGALLFGSVFSVAVCPVCTPALVVLTGVAMASSSPLLGALLLLAFALGRVVPVAGGAWAVGWIKARPGLATYRRGFEAAGGVVLIASGLYMLNAYFFWLPALAG